MIGVALHSIFRADASIYPDPRLRWLPGSARHCNQRDFGGGDPGAAGDLQRSRHLLEEWVCEEPLDCEFSANGTLNVYRGTRWCNLCFAVAHGMLGISVSTATGELVPSPLAGTRAMIDSAPYAAARFGP